MRRREVVVTTPGKIPPEFMLGRCVEVWGCEPGGPPDIEWPHGSTLRAHSRSSSGLFAYAKTVGVEWGTASWNELSRKAKGAPWSITHMITTGRADEVEDRLRAAGVTMADLPRLQRAADRWVKKSEVRHA